ncbi:fibronectin type III domain-containing protein [Flavobacterium stagni]|uniref:T9SS type B sorting domain-containing protein n=1 Tax=Flavobacterium stagni TaxID=2506421 RepID=A0A4Q1KAW7_9FLAO|nr:fibronectin type III domain-containing protein [Flavobacterium stagni]RXR23435.1 T9SS type B sorting domain-containing protein [Flavobacterium stagni]
MKKITLLILFAFMHLTGYSQFPTPGVEGFENTTNPDVATNPSPWTLGTGATGNQWAVFDNGVGTARRWTITTSAANVYAGTNSAFMNNENIGQGNTSEDYLATPKVTVPTNGELHFWTRSTLTGPQGTEYFVLVNPTATAGTQTNIASYTVTAQTYTEATLSTTFNVYEEKVVDLSAYAGQQVYIAFMMRFTQPTTALGGDRWLIDSVSLVERCLVPTNLSATSITQTSALLGWNGTAPQYEVEVVPATGIPTGLGIIVTTNSYSAQGLTPATPYVYYVRALCSQSNSAWVGPFNFTTATPGLTCNSAIAIPTLPYSTNDNTATYADTNDTNQGGSCGSTTNYMIGNEVYYSYTPTTTGAISITMTPGATNSGIFVYQGCANVGVNCVAGVADATSGVRNIPSLNVTAGQTYIIVLSSSAATQSYSYSLIIQQLNCAQPDALTATNIGLNGATLSWGNPGNASSWEYVVQTSGSAIPSGSGTTVGTNTGTAVTGLNPDTAYQYWVRADCGNGTFSAWAGPYVFNTLVPPPVCGGTYTDGGGAAANYANNADQTVTICPQTVGDVVTVTFTSFNVEATNDGLYIFNGNSTSAPQIASANGAGAVPGGLAGAYWGTTNPGSFTSSSPDGCLTFRFRSNATTTAAGWVANVTCAAPPPCPAPFSLTPTVVLGTSATFTWTAGGTENQWEIIAQPCGNTAPTATTVGTIVSTNTHTFQGLNGLTCYDVYVRAICTSPDVSTWTGPVSITTQVAPPVCGGIYVDEGGLTGNYNNNTNQTVTICPDVPTNVVTVTFTSFATEANWDGMYVFDGTSTSAPQIPSANGPGNVPGGLAGSYWGTLTGANLPSFTSSAPGGCLTFQFISDVIINAAGWTANVVCQAPPACPSPSALTVTGVTHNTAVFAWTSASTTPTSWNVIALPCGSPVPTATTTGFFTSNTTSYTFTTLLPNTCYDFYVQSVCPDGSTGWWIGPRSATTQIAPPACGGVFTDPAGPNANYANSTDYTVTICPNSPNEVVTVTFTEFNTETNWDGLYVFDGNSINAPQIASTNGPGNVPGGLAGSYWGNLTGANLPGPFTASTVGGCLTFRFRSDGTVNNPGWIANVTCEPAPPCPKPVALNVQQVTQTSAQLYWTEQGTATQWEIFIVPLGGLPPSGSSIGILTTQMPYTLTNLPAGTAYTFYVRSICNALGETSTWSQPYTFGTLPVNDECSNATFAVVNQNLNCVQTTPGTLIGATQSNPVVNCPPGVANDDVWYTFTATAPTHIVSFNNVTGNADLDYAIFTGTACGNFTQVNCNSADNLIPGTTYYIRIYSASAATQYVNFNLCIGTLPCAEAPAFCTGQTVTYANSTNVPSLGQIGCLFTSPNPAFFFLQVNQAGPLSYLISQVDNNGTPRDVDYVAWGPFTDLNTACIGVPANPMAGQIPALTPAQGCNGTLHACSYSAAPQEIMCIPNAQLCEVYVIMITNFSNQAGTVTFTQTNTTGGTTACFPYNVFEYDSTYYCQDGVDPTPILAAGATAGTYTATPAGLVIDSLTGTIDLSASAPGAYVVTATTATTIGGTCNTIPFITTSRTVIITAPANATIAYSQPAYCNNDFTPQTATVTGTTGGTYSASPAGLNINTITGTIIPGASLPGVYTVSYSIPAIGGCAAFAATTTVTINATPVIPFMANVVQCGDYTLPALTVGNYFTGPGGTGTQLNANDIISTSQTIYIYASSGTTPDCTSERSFTVTITQPVDPIFPVINSICQNATAPVLPTTSDNNIDGTWSPSVIDTSILGSTDYVFTPNSGECGNPLTVSILITTPLTPTFDPITVCQGQTAPALPTTSTNGVSGTWNPATIDTSTIGNFDYVFTPSSGNCAVAVTLTVAITAPTGTPTFTQIAPICQDLSAPALPTTSGEGISGTWSPSVISTTTVGTTTYTFTPNAGQCANTATMDITIFAPNITPTFTAIAPICQNGTAPTLPTTSNNGITGTWSGTVDTTTVGTQTINFTPDAGQCAVATSISVTINAPTTPTFNALAAVCQGSTAVTIPTTSTNGVTGTWSPATFTTATAGTFTSTFTPDAGQCAVGTTISITVHPTPDVLPILDVEACNSYTLPALTVGNYYTGQNGTGTQLNAGAVITATTTLYVYAQSGTTPNCTDQESFDITITPSPAFTIDGGCVGSVYVLEVIPSNFTSTNASYLWTNSSGATVGTGATLNVSGAGVYNVTVTIPNGTGFCTDTQSFTANDVTCSIPKGISPNGDGLNDNFDLTGMNVRQLSIYNRYGTKVYSKGNYTDQWYGQSNDDNELPDGTYYYVIERDGVSDKSGWVYINREIK